MYYVQPSFLTVKAVRKVCSGKKSLSVFGLKLAVTLFKEIGGVSMEEINQQMSTEESPLLKR